MNADTLAAIVARDAEWAEQPDGSLAYTWINVRSGLRKVAPHAMDRDGPADRRALLALLRETRDAARIAETAMSAEHDDCEDADHCRDMAHAGVRDRLRASLARLAALDTEVPS